MKTILMAAAAVFFVTISASAPAFAQEATASGCPFSSGASATSDDDCGFAAADKANAIAEGLDETLSEVKELKKKKRDPDVRKLVETLLEADKELIDFQLTYKEWYDEVGDGLRDSVRKDIEKAVKTAEKAVKTLRNATEKALEVN